MAYTAYLIGEEYVNNDGETYRITGYCDNDRKRIVTFIKTGNEYEIHHANIKRGAVRDSKSYVQKICGVGINDLKTSKHPLYGRWQQMIRRCYDRNNDSYKDYGAKGVIVCDEWHIFSNYIKDIEQKENYDKLLKNPNDWAIDKDILSKDVKIYSNETTIIITKTDNSKEMSSRVTRFGVKRKGKPVIQYDLKGNKINEFNKMVEAEKITGIKADYISSCAKGWQKTAGGFVWKYKEEDKYGK